MLEKVTVTQLAAICAALSTPRLERYIAASDCNRRRALALYQWNAQISAAFMLPMHICEVVLRNAIVDAIERVYGPHWFLPGSGFEGSLPRPASGYSPFNDLGAARANYPSAGKIVPEVKLMFWVSMLTSRHQSRLWNPFIRTSFPNIPQQLTTATSRRLLHDQVDAIRIVRNRIAHHEPIFTRDIHAEYRRLHRIVHWRSTDAAQWLNEMQTVTALMRTKP